MSFSVQAGPSFTFDTFKTMLGAVLVTSIIGIQPAWGTILPYVTGYFRDFDFDIHNSQFYSVYPTIIIVTTLMFPVGMKLAEIRGPKM